MNASPRPAGDRVVVYVPDLPELPLMGDIPVNVDLVRVPPEDGPMPDLVGADLVIPNGRMREPLLELLRAPGRLRVIQTLTAGVDWLVGQVPPRVTVCNARGVFDGPLAEWVIGAILAMQRGLVRARDAQAHGTWTEFEADELAGQRVVIVGYGSIGAAVAERLRPFGVEVIGVARSPRDGTLGLDDLDVVLPGATILVDLLPLTSQTAGFLDARRLARLPDGALVVNAGRGRTVDTDALVAELRARPAPGRPRRDGPRTATGGSCPLVASERPHQPAHGGRFAGFHTPRVRAGGRPGPPVRRRATAGERRRSLPARVAGQPSAAAPEPIDWPIAAMS